MNDTPIYGWEPPHIVPITSQQEGVPFTATQFITLSHVVSVTRPFTDATQGSQFIGFQKVFSGGLSIISTTFYYSETHLFHATAFDSAGNETKSEPVRLKIGHEQKKEKDEDEATTDDDEAFLAPAFDDHKNNYRVRQNLWRQLI
jgi:hypothetical protein